MLEFLYKNQWEEWLVRIMAGKNNAQISFENDPIAYLVYLKKLAGIKF
ncbi:MAG: hypothetical protein ACI37S_05765 [Candidatus Gastranaerophilaceae bacterium]